MGGNEVCRVSRRTNIFVRRCAALALITIEQGNRGRAPQDEGELPGKVYGILEPGIRTACSKRGDLMSGVACEDNPPMNKPLHAPALKLIYRYPFEFEFLVSQHAFDPRPHILRKPFNGGVRVWDKLQIDAPYVVGLAVKQRGLSGMECR